MTLRPVLRELLPDVQIYYNAVHYALTYNEFFSPGEMAWRSGCCKRAWSGRTRSKEGKAPWITATGLIVRGYVSQHRRLGAALWPGRSGEYQAGSALNHRLDIWSTAAAKPSANSTSSTAANTVPASLRRRNAFVLHPYGRYCNANKFAGEVDTLEALESVRKHYPIDENRIAVRGFSMGGAACWQFAVHFAGDWVAAAPGAGFAETAQFLNIFQHESVKPTWYEEKLWHLYDSTDYALNLFNCPTVAYSGEINTQKQAADMMSRALEKEGITLVHIIGPGAAHFYEPHAKQEVARRIDEIVAHGRNPVPWRVRFTTWTLRYNKMFWLSLDGLDHHWERARVDANILNPETVQIRTMNVSALTLSMPPGYCPLDMTVRPRIVLDGQNLTAPSPLSDRSWEVHLRKVGSHWDVVDSPDDGKLRKRPGLQGPIDDAFYDSFLMVTPTGQPMNAKVGEWEAAEQTRAIVQWRQQFRGEAPVKKNRRSRRRTSPRTTSCCGATRRATASWRRSPPNSQFAGTRMAFTSAQKLMTPIITFPCSSIRTRSIRIGTSSSIAASRIASTTTSTMPARFPSCRTTRLSM